MIQHKGIDHLKTLVLFAVSLGAGIKKATEDGKFSIGDAWALWPVAKTAPAAFRDIGQVPAELADLDAPEAEEIVQAVEAHLGELADSARARDIADAALDVVPHLANLVNTIVNPPPVAEPA